MGYVNIYIYIYMFLGNVKCGMRNVKCKGTLGSGKEGREGGRVER